MSLICPMLSALPPTDETGQPVNKECIYEKCRFFEREQRDCSLMMSSRAMLRVAEQLAARPPEAPRDAAPAPPPISPPALAAELAPALAVEIAPALAAAVAQAVAVQVSQTVAAQVSQTVAAEVSRLHEAVHEAGEASETASDRVALLEAQLADMNQTLTRHLQNLESRIASRPAPAAPPPPVPTLDPAPLRAAINEGLQAIAARLEAKAAARHEPSLAEDLTAVRVMVEEGFQALAARLEAKLTARPDTSIGSDLASLRRTIDEGFLTLATRLDTRVGGRAEGAPGKEATALRTALEEGLKSLTTRMEQQARALVATVPVADQLRKEMATLNQTQQHVAEKVLEEMSLVGLNSHKLEQTVGAMEKKVDKYVNDTHHVAQVLTLVKGETERTFAALRSINEGNRAVIKAIETQLQRDQAALQGRQRDEALQCNNRGVVLYYRGALDAAAEALGRAIELQPDYAEAHNNLGLVLSKLGRAQEAADAFQKALKIDPRMGEAYNNLGFLFHTSAQFERAVEMFGQAIESAADSSIAYTNLGNSYYKLKQPEKAVGAWRRALELDPMNETARRGLRMFEQDAGSN